VGELIGGIARMRKISVDEAQKRARSIHPARADLHAGEVRTWRCLSLVTGELHEWGDHHARRRQRKALLD